MTDQEKFDEYVTNLSEELEGANYHSEGSILDSLVRSLKENKVKPALALKIVEGTNFWS